MNLINFKDIKKYIYSSQTAILSVLMHHERTLLKVLVDSVNTDSIFIVLHNQKGVTSELFKTARLLIFERASDGYALPVFCDQVFSSSLFFKALLKERSKNCLSLKDDKEDLAWSFVEETWKELLTPKETVSFDGKEEKIFGNFLGDILEKKEPLKDCFFPQENAELIPLNVKDSHTQKGGDEGVHLLCDFSSSEEGGNSHSKYCFEIVRLIELRSSGFSIQSSRETDIGNWIYLLNAFSSDHFRENLCVVVWAVKNAKKNYTYRLRFVDKNHSALTIIENCVQGKDLPRNKNEE